MCVRAERRGCFRSSDTSPRAAGNEGDPKGSFASCSQFAEEEIVNKHPTSPGRHLHWEKAGTVVSQSEPCRRRCPVFLHRVGEGQV